MEKEGNFNTHSAPEPPRRSNKTPIFIGVFILLVLIIGYFIWRTQQLETERKRQEKELSETYLRLDSIAGELDQRILAIQELGGQIDTLIAIKTQLENDKKALLARSADRQKQITRLNSKVEGYRELLILKDEEIERLKEINYQLTAENTTLKVEKNELSDSIQQLQQNTEELASKVATASKLAITGLSVYAITKKGKERKDEFKNRHIHQLKVQFTVMDNEVAPVEGKELLLRIVAPDGKALFDVTRGSGSFTYEGRDLFYTAKQEILYDKKSQQVSYLYSKGSDYAIGQHKVEVYTDDYLMGTGIFVVK